MDEEKLKQEVISRAMEDLYLSNQGRMVRWLFGSSFLAREWRGGVCIYHWDGGNEEYLLSPLTPASDPVWRLVAPILGIEIIAS